MRTAHVPFSLSSEFHPYGVAPRTVGKALACFDTRHVPYFMPMTFLPMTFNLLLLTSFLHCPGHRRDIVLNKKRIKDDKRQ
jgi:hypothetical protein